MPRLALLALLLPLMAGCAYGSYDHLTYEPSAYRGAGSSYAPTPAQAFAPVPDSYCVEAVAEAQDAAARASVTGTPLDAGRAERTAHFARRDCR